MTRREQFFQVMREIGERLERERLERERAAQPAPAQPKPKAQSGTSR